MRLFNPTEEVSDVYDGLRLRSIFTWICERTGSAFGVMVYTFTGINAVLQMKMRDYFVQGRCGWVWLHEKGTRSMKFLVTTI
ncbi:MAG: hypothetical protein V7K48_32880 [Nostoc sp.]|uniref:hypothetical protein n=1 Tax=Nostoc sp. TaxID=1180 RepID=UPI002FFA9232